MSHSITMACLYCLHCTEPPESCQIRLLENPPSLERYSDSAEATLQPMLFLTHSGI